MLGGSSVTKQAICSSIKVSVQMLVLPLFERLEHRDSESDTAT